VLQYVAVCRGETLRARQEYISLKHAFKALLRKRRRKQRECQRGRSRERQREKRRDREGGKGGREGESKMDLKREDTGGRECVRERAGAGVRAREEKRERESVCERVWVEDRKGVLAMRCRCRKIETAKRALYILQKSPTHSAKEPYIFRKRAVRKCLSNALDVQEDRNGEKSPIYSKQYALMLHEGARRAPSWNIYIWNIWNI